mmetsp:Transcript_25563/g.50022  ORF Transcript_25563/g.50022 Transcript_25563/m.50022 type:complete len:170 (-) Transcript_25563:319-828(-)
MLKTPCTTPGYCCFACVCAPCVIYLQRDQIIGDGKYQCCLGIFPCCTMNCPKIPCLCCEAFCCPGLAASANRIFIMQKLQIQPDPCDEYIICCSNIMQIVACCVRLCSDDPSLADCCTYAADLMFCVTLSCMQAQVEYEVDNNEKTNGVWPSLEKELPDTKGDNKVNMA